jgi:hypothetical protein
LTRKEKSSDSEADERLKQVVALAERRRIENAQELSIDELRGIGHELGLSAEEMAQASVEVSALASPQPLTVTTSEDVLVLASRRPSFGFPLLGRIATTIALQIFTLGWALRTRPESQLMALAAVPIIGVASWFLYRCLGLALERTVLRLGKTCHLSVRSLPLIGRDISFSLRQFDVLQPEMMTDHDGGFEIAPIFSIPVRIKGSTVNLCTAHKKSDLNAAYAALVDWLSHREDRFA